jgi:hypothetical protein
MTAPHQPQNPKRTAEWLYKAKNRVLEPTTATPRTRHVPRHAHDTHFAPVIVVREQLERVRGALKLRRPEPIRRVLPSSEPAHPQAPARGPPEPARRFPRAVRGPRPGSAARPRENTTPSMTGYATPARSPTSTSDGRSPPTPTLRSTPSVHDANPRIARPRSPIVGGLAQIFAGPPRTTRLYGTHPEQSQEKRRNLARKRPRFGLCGCRPQTL